MKNQSGQNNVPPPLPSGSPKAGVVSAMLHSSVVSGSPSGAVAFPVTPSSAGVSPMTPANGMDLSSMVPGAMQASVARMRTVVPAIMSKTLSMTPDALQGGQDHSGFGVPSIQIGGMQHFDMHEGSHSAIRPGPAHSGSNLADASKGLNLVESGSKNVDGDSKNVNMDASKQVSQMPYKQGSVGKRITTTLETSNAEATLAADSNFIDRDNISSSNYDNPTHGKPRPRLDSAYRQEGDGRIHGSPDIYKNLSPEQLDRLMKNIGGNIGNISQYGIALEDLTEEKDQEVLEYISDHICMDEPYSDYDIFNDLQGATAVMRATEVKNRREGKDINDKTGKDTSSAKTAGIRNYSPVAKKDTAAFKPMKMKFDVSNKIAGKDSPLKATDSLKKTTNSAAKDTAGKDASRKETAMKEFPKKKEISILQRKADRPGQPWVQKTIDPKRSPRGGQARGMDQVVSTQPQLLAISFKPSSETPLEKQAADLATPQLSVEELAKVDPAELAKLDPAQLAMMTRQMAMEIINQTVGHRSFPGFFYGTSGYSVGPHGMQYNMPGVNQAEGDDGFIDPMYGNWYDYGAAYPELYGGYQDGFPAPKPASQDYNLDRSGLNRSIGAQGGQGNRSHSIPAKRKHGGGVFLPVETDENLGTSEDTKANRAHSIPPKRIGVVLPGDNDDTAEDVQGARLRKGKGKAGFKGKDGFRSDDLNVDEGGFRVDDFIRVFLQRRGMSKTLDSFSKELHDLHHTEKKTMRDVIGEIYGNNKMSKEQKWKTEKQLQDEFELAKIFMEAETEFHNEDELKKRNLELLNLVKKTSSQFDKFKKERDWHRSMYRNATVERKNLLQDLYRVKNAIETQHEPLIASLRKKYEALMKEKTLMTIDRDRKAEKLQRLESELQMYSLVVNGKSQDRPGQTRGSSPNSDLSSLRFESISHSPMKSSSMKSSPMKSSPFKSQPGSPMKSQPDSPVKSQVGSPLKIGSPPKSSAGSPHKTTGGSFLVNVGRGGRAIVPKPPDNDGIHKTVFKPTGAPPSGGSPYIKTPIQSPLKEQTPKEASISLLPPKKRAGGDKSSMCSSDGVESVNDRGRNLVVPPIPLQVEYALENPTGPSQKAKAKSFLNKEEITPEYFHHLYGSVMDKVARVKAVGKDTESGESGMPGTSTTPQTNANSGGNPNVVKFSPGIPGSRPNSPVSPGGGGSPSKGHDVSPSSKKSPFRQKVLIATPSKVQEDVKYTCDVEKVAEYMERTVSAVQSKHKNDLNHRTLTNAMLSSAFSGAGGSTTTIEAGVTSAACKIEHRKEILRKFDEQGGKEGLQKANGYIDHDFCISPQTSPTDKKRFSSNPNAHHYGSPHNRGGYGGNNVGPDGQPVWTNSVIVNEPFQALNSFGHALSKKRLIKEETVKREDRNERSVERTTTETSKAQIMGLAARYGHKFGGLGETSSRDGWIDYKQRGGNNIPRNHDQASVFQYAEGSGITTSNVAYNTQTGYNPNYTVVNGYRLPDTPWPIEEHGKVLQLRNIEHIKTIVDQDLCVYNNSHNIIRYVDEIDFKQTHTAPISRCVMHPSLSLVATAGDDSVWKMFAVPTGDLVLTGEGHGDWVSDIGFHRMGNIVATTSGDSMVKLWNLEKGVCVHSFDDFFKPTWSCDFHDFSDFCAVSSMEGTTKIFDIGALRCRQTLRGHVDSINYCKFAHYSNQIATCSSDKSVSVWDLRSGLCVKTFYGHTRSVNSLDWSPDNLYLVSADADGFAKIRDLRLATDYLNLDAGSSSANCAKFDVLGKGIIVGSADGSLLSFDVGNKKFLQAIPGHKDLGHTDAVQDICFNRMNAEIISVGSDRRIKFWRFSEKYAKTDDKDYGKKTL